MPKLKLDAIAVSATDMKKSVEFYKLLGFEFDEWDSDDHVEPITNKGEVRLMIDSAELMTKLNGAPPTPPNHSAFAMLCANPAEVDEVYSTITNAGFMGTTQPWDAFWGQRYATVSDPDGYKIDLFAPL